MVLAVYDHNPFKMQALPVVTWSLIAVNCLVFLIQVSLGDDGNVALIRALGSTPARIATMSFPVPADLTLLSCMFLHEGWAHLIGNMLYLFVFGDDIEVALGRARFVIFYFGCGLAATLAFVAVGPNSNLPLIGASGAIAGVLSAYLLIRPCARVTVLFRVFPIPLPAVVVIGIWVLMQIYAVSDRPDDNVAYVAHIGGLIAGIVLFLLLRPKNVRLFECLWNPEKSFEQASTN